LSLNPDKHSRVRHFGKRVTNLDLALFCAEQLKTRSKSQLCKELGISRPTLDALCELVDIKKEEIRSVRIQYNEELEGKLEQFQEIPEVKIWLDFMDGKARAGKPFPARAKRLYLIQFWNICRTIKVAPVQWLYGQTTQETLESGRKLMQAFMKEYMAGNATIKYTKDVRLIDPIRAAYTYSKAPRDFMKSHGFAYPTGESGVMSQSVTSFHGKYADVRIPEETVNRIKAELAEEYGTDSDQWLIFAYGLESMARHQSLIATPTKFEEIRSAGKTVLITENYESKTSQYKKGIWKKYIFDETLQHIIRARKGRGMDTLFSLQAKGPRGFKQEFIEMLKTKDHKHGLTEHGQEIQGDKNSSYFVKHPVHALRHAGAQRLLRATNWNVAFVAKRGWKTTQELIDSYGEMPPDMEAKALGEVAF